MQSCHGWTKQGKKFPDKTVCVSCVHVCVEKGQSAHRDISPDWPNGRRQAVSSFGTSSFSLLLSRSLDDCSSPTLGTSCCCSSLARSPPGPGAVFSMGEGDSPRLLLSGAALLGSSPALTFSPSLSLEVLWEAALACAWPCGAFWLWCQRRFWLGPRCCCCCCGPPPWRGP